ncbi:MAG TPA: hypothetical protein CFH81_00340 [Sulfurovum sp. UBA12169]|nr:MAG TPA: hypothetical protein CFH81_00340 [Sulfurovum sp. UBA12169]
MRTVVDIHIEENDYEKRYFISTPSGIDGIPLHLSADMSLTRVKTKRAYVRDLANAQKIAGLIFAGEIREGIAYSNVKKSVQEVAHENK